MILPQVTLKYSHSHYLSSTEEMQLLTHLCKYLGFKKVIDVGEFSQGQLLYLLSRLVVKWVTCAHLACHLLGRVQAWMGAIKSDSENNYNGGLG